MSKLYTLVGVVVGAVVAVGIALILTVYIEGLTQPAYGAEACKYGSIEEVQAKSDNLKGKFVSSTSTDDIKAVHDFITKLFPASDTPTVNAEWAKTAQIGIYVGPTSTPTTVVFMFDATGCIVDWITGIKGGDVPTFGQPSKGV